jgi:hypothetical protein
MTKAEMEELYYLLIMAKMKQNWEKLHAPKTK